MLTANEILESVERLAEHNWKLWVGDELTNDSNVSMTRYIGGLNEIQLDGFLEFLRRFVSAKNHSTFNLKVSGGVSPDVNGTYLESTEVVLGQPVFVRDDGLYEFRVAVSDETGAFYWKLTDLVNGIVQWISSGGATKIVDATYWTATEDGVTIPLKLGDAAASLTSVSWVPAVSQPTADMMVSTDMEFTVDGILSGASGDLSVGYLLPDSGIQYRIVEDPEVNNGKVRDGIWRAGSLHVVRDADGRYGAKGTFVILQTLELEINTSASFLKSETRWRVLNLKAFRSGSRNIVLELPYCDPTLVQELADANSDSLYDSAIYTLNAGLLEGKWYSSDKQVEIDKETGYGRILWFVRSHNNDDLGFVYQSNKRELRLDFWKLRLAPDGVADFRKNYYFDVDGSFYVSANGSEYTAKDGEAAEGTLPDTAKTLDVYSEGRGVESYDVSPDRESGEVDLHIRLFFRVGSEAVGRIVRRDYGTVETVLDLVDATEADCSEFFERTYLAANGDWFYSVYGVNYTQKNGEVADGALADVGAVALGENVEGRSVRFQQQYDERDKGWTLKVEVLHGVADDRTGFAESNHIAFKSSDGVSVLRGRGFNVSRSELTTVQDYYNTAVASGTSRVFEFTRLANGNYDYAGVETVRTGWQDSFTVGETLFYVGFHMPKPPSTDSTAGADYTIISGSGVAGAPQVTFNEEDASWSWRIAFKSAVSHTGDGSDPVVTYGEPLEKIRLVEETSGTDLPNGGSPDVGEYEDVAVLNDGSALGSTVSGRRLVQTRYDNFQFLDGLYHYRKLEVELNAPINPGFNVPISGAELVRVGDVDFVFSGILNIGSLSVGDSITLNNAAVYTGTYVITAISGSTLSVDTEYLGAETGSLVKWTDGNVTGNTLSSVSGDNNTRILSNIALRLPLAVGHNVLISGTTSYEGSHEIISLEPSSFVIAKTFVADELGEIAVGNDAWFHAGASRMAEKERQSFFSGVTWQSRPQDNINTLYTGLRNPISGWESVPENVDSVVSNAWRIRTDVRFRKYFVRLPQQVDMDSAAIGDLIAPETALGAEVKQVVTQVSRNLFAIERVVTFRTQRQADSSDVAMEGFAEYTVNEDVGPGF